MIKIYYAFCKLKLWSKLNSSKAWSTRLWVTCYVQQKYDALLQALANVSVHMIKIYYAFRKVHVSKNCGAYYHAEAQADKPIPSNVGSILEYSACRVVQVLWHLHLQSIWSYAKWCTTTCLHAQCTIWATACLSQRANNAIYKTITMCSDLQVCPTK